MSSKIIGIIAVIVIISLVVMNIYSFQNNKDKERVIRNAMSDKTSLESRVQELEKEVSELADENKSLLEIISSYRQVSQASLSRVSLTSIHASTDGNATVVYRVRGCDYFILENNMGYIIAEWFGGNDPDVGDNISGDFHSFGTKDYYNQSKSTGTRLWLDDYMLSKESALEKIKDHCR
ncbi:MAG: hypothetical protein K9G49_10055 [Taibaiella sp.]|nr:hypothetical protein [Taibaiella sp.]